MNDKIAMIKEALAKRKKGKKSKVAKHASVNPAIESTEKTPGVKTPLPLKGNKGGKPVKSNAPFWVKPKGTPENPDKTADPSEKVNIKKKKHAPFWQKAKTRGGD